MNYYNENDPHAAAWLRELILAGEIPEGRVDERSIVDVQPSDLKGYDQHHFFAGIGGWPLALRLAGVAPERRIWTGSCPCQPLSCAGLGRGEKDERHLWPEFYRLISECRPECVLGEQVASADGLEWVNGVSLDLEELGYAVGTFDLPAAWVSAPQLRQRIYWVAHACGGRLHLEQGIAGIEEGERQRGHQSSDSSGVIRLAHATSPGCQGRIPESLSRRPGFEQRSSAARVGYADDEGPQGRSVDRNRADEWSPWSASVAVCGNDGVWRRTFPGIPPLASRLPGRVALIRGSGNAIVPQCAARFIRAALDL